MGKEYLPCVCLSARRAALALTSYYDRALSEVGITTNQFSLLINIKAAGKTNISGLAKMVRLEKSTLTRELTPLIKSGYIHSERGENKRETLLTLTELGQETMRKAFPIWRKKQAEMAGFVGGEDELEHFMTVLLKFQELKGR